MGGSDVDDAPPFSGLHQGQGVAHGVERGRQVDGDDRVPALGRKILDQRNVLYAGVVDQDIDRAEAGGRPGDEIGDLVGFGHVGRVIVNSGTKGGDVLFCAVDGGGFTKAVEHDIGTVGG